MAQINKYSRMQILLSGHMDRFAYMQNLRIRKLRFRPSTNFVYTQILRIRKSEKKNVVRFAYVSKICIYATFAYVSKSAHVTRALE